MIPDSNSNPQKQNKKPGKGKHVTSYERIIVTTYSWVVTYLDTTCIHNDNSTTRG